MANILIYALHYEGAINKNSLGAVSEGARLAGELGGEAHVIMLGENISQELAASLGSYGASKVLVASGPEGLAQPVVDAMAKAITDGDYGYALFGGGLLGFEIGAGLAARLGAGVAMEVTNVRAEGGELIAERPILGDSAISEIKYRSPVGIAVQFVHAGHRAGPGSEVILPDPADDRCITEIEGLPVLTLARLVESKLACGQANLRRTHKDFADVVELIQRRRLTSAFARFLHRSLRATFRQLVRNARGKP